MDSNKSLRSGSSVNKFLYTHVFLLVSAIIFIPFVIVTLFVPVIRYKVQLGQNEHQVNGYLFATNVENWKGGWNENGNLLNILEILTSSGIIPLDEKSHEQTLYSAYVSIFIFNIIALIYLANVAWKRTVKNDPVFLILFIIAAYTSLVLSSFTIDFSVKNSKGIYIKIYKPLFDVQLSLIAFHTLGLLIYEHFNKKKQK